MPEILKKLKKALNKSSAKNITPAQARAIQEAHIKSQEVAMSKKNIKTPPYHKIKEHIFDENLQIAKCAVFNISQVAIYNSKHKMSILKILTEILQQKNIAQDLEQYIIQSIQNINNS